MCQSQYYLMSELKIPYMQRYLSWGAMALVLATLVGFMRPQTTSAQVTEICNSRICYGITWRTPDLKILRELPPDTVSTEGRLPIHYAAINCSPQAAFESLAVRGADFNVRDLHSGLTPLQIALQVCSQGTLTTLLNYGADANMPLPKVGGNVLHLAIKNDKPLRTFRLLIDSEIDLDAEDDEGLTPLILLLIRKDIDLVVELLEAGADPNVADANGTTVTHYAAQIGNVDLLSKLRQLGANLEVRNVKEQTPLHLAAIHGMTPELVAVFLLAKVKTNPIDAAGLSPMHYAAAQTSARAIASLRVLGTPVDTLDKQDESSLHYALRYNEDPLAIRALLLFGADPNQPTADNKLPTQLATAHRHSDTLLALVDAGADIDAKDEFGRTLLHHAVLQSNAEVAVSLLESGADPNVPDIIGRTPLELAFQVPIAEPALSVFTKIQSETEQRLQELDYARQQRLLERQERLQQRSEQNQARRQAARERRNKIRNESVGEHRIKDLERRQQRVEKNLERAEDSGAQSQVERYQELLDDVEQEVQTISQQLEEIREAAKERNSKNQ